jgi:starvation-inducible DNA-binding protein
LQPAKTPYLKANSKIPLSSEANRRFALSNKSEDLIGMSQVASPLESMNIGIKDANREVIIGRLNGLLADLHVVYIKTRNYHWNLTGKQFFTLHKEFETLYNGLAEDIDEVAERIRILGGIATGSMAQFAKDTHLKEDSGVPEAAQMVTNLLSDYEATIRELRSIAETAGEHADSVTEDFCIGMMGEYEKTAWMLRSVAR